MPVRVAAALVSTVPVRPPNSDVEITVRMATNRDVLGRQNLFDKVRYIQQDGDGTTVTERSFPMGDLQVETVLLVATGWNLTDGAGVVYPITRKNVLDLLTPEEFKYLYAEIIKMNPVWNGSEGEA